MSHTSKEDELPEIWPSLVEKAYAKSLGSYAKILEADFPTILRDLTGAPCTILAIDDSKQLRDEIEDALKKGQFVAACAKDAGVGESKSNQIGIQSGFSYPITASWPGDKVRLLNPFQTEINGFEYNNQLGGFIMNF